MIGGQNPYKRVYRRVLISMLDVAKDGARVLASVQKNSKSSRCAGAGTEPVKRLVPR